MSFFLNRYLQNELSTQNEKTRDGNELLVCIQKLLDRQFLQLERLESNNEGYLEDVCADYFKDAAKFVGLIVPEL